MNGYPPGKKYIDCVDVKSADYLRPADIKQDVRQMSERKRVNEILKSKEFREDLEKVVVEKIATSPQDKASLKALQQVSDLTFHQARLRYAPVFSDVDTRGICDVRGSCDTPEKINMCRLACLSRLLKVPLFLSYKLDEGKFISSSSVLRGDQASASSFESKGDSGNEEVDAVFAARDDAVCVTVIKDAAVLETIQRGVLALSKQAVLLNEVLCPDIPISSESFVHPYKVGVSSDGVMIVSSSISEAFFLSRNLLSAVSIQARAEKAGIENVEMLTDDAQKRIVKNFNNNNNSNNSNNNTNNKYEGEFETAIRKLQYEGHKTGLKLKEPARSDKAYSDNDVELPPTVVAIACPQSGKPPVYGKQTSFSEYLNSPHAYKKEQVDVAPGTPYHKVVTKWVPETSLSSTAIKLDSANQFVPVNTDPGELKQAVKLIRKEYYDEKITSGPSSKVLEGPSWEEAQKMKEGNTNAVVMVGAASQGIIQKGHQNEATLYTTYYAPNPFDDVTPHDVEAYQLEVQQKRPGSKSVYLSDTTTEDEAKEGELVSTEERLQQFKLQQQQHQEQDKPQHHQQYQQLLQKAPTKQQQKIEFQSPTQSMHCSQLSKEVTSPASPCKSVSSVEGGGNEVLSANESGNAEVKKKKKRGFKMPSFSKKKDKK